MAVELNSLLAQYPVADINLEELSLLDKQKYFADSRTIRVSFDQKVRREKFIFEFLDKFKDEPFFYISIDPNCTQDIRLRNFMDALGDIDIHEWGDVKQMNEVDPEIKVIFIECGGVEISTCYHGVSDFLREKIYNTRIHKDSLIVMVG